MEPSPKPAADASLPGGVTKLSAIIITKNEAANIADCLDTIAFCGERIVVDCGSTDDTVRLAREKGAHVVHQDWLGFGAQKNFALGLATREWVFSIDADERVSPLLASEIASAVAAGEADGYEIPRQSSFCGQVMRHSGWYPDYVLRLYRRSAGRFSDALVHEHVVCTGRVARLSAPLLHKPVKKLEEALARMNSYSTLNAQMIVASGQRVSFASGIARGLWSFLRGYVLRLGFLDGREGFLLAVANAEGTYYKYMKAWLAGRNVRPRQLDLGPGGSGPA
jgi:glycosyltransferase involved in cell wall biosynthesis